MSDRERNPVNFVFLWSDRHPQATLVLAALFFLAGLALCARVV